MSSLDTTKEWREELKREMWGQHWFGNPWDEDQIDSKFLVSFIEKVESQSRQELVKELLEEIDRVDLKVIYREFTNKDMVEFYKNAVNETKRVIKELLSTHLNKE